MWHCICGVENFECTYVCINCGSRRRKLGGF